MPSALAVTPENLDASTEDYARALRAANINPHTGLATDYLNHFNEVVMLLDLLPSVPELRDEVLAWRPADYKAHFQQTGFREKELAIEAYDLSPPCHREPFDETISCLTDQILDVQAVLLSRTPEEAAGHITAARDEILSSIARASAIVNSGAVVQTEVEATQDAIDSLFD
ncbi:hypothetical protein GCM10007276_11430 [Agaricicola taiwanensis]|uniref:Uncharacterized protein n=1 Tax=Agaricicola taiwanensis TaxID=591372 RepID=A0A8J2VP02_9RHOB|nr:hypothetical protein [Agaricicola taiwanensis]GGE35699.1 hypothetical protein GCM10007276_11430 [Agaricicola taiwanensis]